MQKKISNTGLRLTKLIQVILKNIDSTMTIKEI